MTTTHFENQPDIKISVKQTFGFDSDLTINAFSKKNGAVNRFYQERLGIAGTWCSGCGVASVTNCVLSCKWGKCVRSEHLTHKTNIFMESCLLAIGDSNTCSLLSSMLQCEQTEKGELGGVWFGR